MIYQIKSAADFKNPQLWPPPRGIWKLFYVASKQADGSPLPKGKAAPFYAALPFIKTDTDYVRVGWKKRTYDSLASTLKECRKTSFDKGTGYWQLESLYLVDSKDPKDKQAGGLGSTIMSDYTKKMTQTAEKNAEDFANIATAAVAAGAAFVGYRFWKRGKR